MDALISTVVAKDSPVQLLVARACDLSQLDHEPNYALQIEVAEYINTKKANNPRDAAMMIARLANHRNSHIALLALSLLDTLVQSCGYPFHLQISTKEFLNELVRRFPERPPPFPGPVMSRILEIIHGWKEGICVESRWKEDLGNIRDMHRLLTFKGYRFREMSRAPSLATAANIKSAEELESEDREAQSAKLQELIRRGTPRDLVAAQDLMKALAGANPDAKPDYRSQALTELNKLEQKVILLNEMLDNADTERGERFASGDVYEQVASILSSARPKLQKWISDAQTDDPESLDTFLQINDQINTVLNRYEAFKKGDYVTSSNPIPAEFAANSSSSITNDLSLIDFGDGSQSSNAPKSGNDDLTDLFGPPTSANPPIPTMGSRAPSSITTYAPSPLPSNGSGFGMGLRSNINAGMYPPQSSATPPASIMLPGTPAPQPRQSPNYFGNGGNIAKSSSGGTGLGTNVVTPQSVQSQSQLQQHRQQPTNPSSSSQVQGKDPFADLAGLF